MTICKPTSETQTEMHRVYQLFGVIFYPSALHFSAFQLGPATVKTPSRQIRQTKWRCNGLSVWYTLPYKQIQPVKNFEFAK